VLVRAIGMPAAMCFVTLQGAFLGAKDWRPPVVAAIVACAANLIADVVLVIGLKMGVVGAAIGTVSAQVGAMATLLYVRRRRQGRAPTCGPTGPTTSELDGVPVAVDANARSGGEVGVGGIDGAGGESGGGTGGELSRWAQFALPLGLGTLARVANVGLVTAASTASGVVACGAHQVLMTLFWAVCPFGDAVSQCAQTYLPSARAMAVRRKLRQRLVTLGVGVGCLSAAACLLPLLMAEVFTADVLVCAAIRQMVPVLMLCAALYPAASSQEGVLIGSQDQLFVAKLYALSPLLTLGLLKALGQLRALPLGGPPGLGVAWTAFAIFQGLRATGFAARMATRPMSEADECRVSS